MAGALLAARVAGVRSAIPFTGEDNVPTQRTYRGLGFGPVEIT